VQTDADTIGGREHILLSTILRSYRRNGKDIDVETLIRSIQISPFDKGGFLGQESFHPASDRFKLAMSLNNLPAGCRIRLIRMATPSGSFEPLKSQNRRLSKRRIPATPSP